MKKFITLAEKPVVTTVVTTPQGPYCPAVVIGAEDGFEVKYDKTEANKGEYPLGTIATLTCSIRNEVFFVNFVATEDGSEFSVLCENGSFETGGRYCDETS